MKSLPPFPVTTPFFDESLSVLDNQTGQESRQPKKPAHPVLRWFQQVAALKQAEFAEETPKLVKANPLTYSLVNAPNPVSSLNFYFVAGMALQLVAPSTYSVLGNIVTFNSPQNAVTPYATYRY